MRSVWIAVICALALNLAACSAVVMETAKKAREDRTADHQWTDTQIATGILSNLNEKDSNLLLDVSVDVWEQRVLLTGTVTAQQMRHDLVRYVQADPRVLKVHNEIQVVSKEEQARRRALAKPAPALREGANRVISDVWIETKISAQLIAAQDITSVNYRWRAVRSTVYLIGRALTRSELSAVLGIVRGTDGVSQVKSYIEIKPLNKS